ncbi:hypothetical protein EDB84DRAFT_1149378 [Lactarius hengduanensis]|nr:hypothetical protein EDB84DRAFT_1149378 [Lactarius hengduanensis]
MLRPLVTHLLHFELFLRDRQRLSVTVYSTEYPTVAQWRMKRMTRPDWPRAHYSEFPHPAAHSPRLETSILLMVVLQPPTTCQSTCYSFSHIFGSPVCRLAWMKGRMRVIVLSGTKAITRMCSTPCSVLPCPLKCMGSHTADRLCHSRWCVHRLYPLFHCAHSEPSISMRTLHTLALAVYFTARSSPTGERRPCHVRLLPQL